LANTGSIETTSEFFAGLKRLRFLPRNSVLWFNGQHNDIYCINKLIMLAEVLTLRFFASVFSVSGLISDTQELWEWRWQSIH